jgi:hypothetical protein
MSDYRFDAAFPADHFVSRYIAYASRQTDAAHEYHEALALALMATATPDVRAEIKQFPHALRTNLYIALVGSTSKSRKSTAKDIAIDVAQRAFPSALLSDTSTPEAFAMELAEHRQQASLWGIDEFAALLVQMHRREYLAGLVKLVLELYGKPDYVYKRVKGNVAIRDAHLTIIGCAADTVFDALHSHDVESGLLPRFAIVYPERKPPRLPFAASAETDQKERNELVYRLSKIAPPRDDQGRWTGDPRRAFLTRDAFEAVDVFAQEHENTYDGEMFRRLLPMVLKVAVLASVGSAAFALGRDGVTVTVDDVRSAITVVSRWTRFADAFTRRLGESRVENLVRRASDFLRTRNKEFVTRRAVARHLHIDSRAFADVERTMLDRELIEHVVVRDSKQRCWKWLDFVKEEGTAA